MPFNYQPIENYALIGDLNTVALVGLDGSIDFMCFPNFDSPSIFAALLDKDKGGHFVIAPTTDDIKHKQLYLPDTNVLLTRFLARHGVAELTDFMPVEERYGGKELARRVTCIQGEFEMAMQCAPRFDYARAQHRIEQIDAHEISFISEGSDQTVLSLKSNVELRIVGQDAVAEFQLKKGQTADFILEQVNRTEAS